MENIINWVKTIDNWTDIFIILGILFTVVGLIWFNVYIDKKAHELSIKLLEPNDELLVADNNNYTIRVKIVDICHTTKTATVCRLAPVDIIYKIEFKQIKAVL